MSQMLLDNTNAPLNHLALHRVQVDATHPSVTLKQMTRCECLLYSLCGQVSVVADNVFLGVLGNRRSVKEQRIHAARFYTGRERCITVTLQGYAADLLWVTYTCEDSTLHTNPLYIHWNDAIFHDVGEGCYRRTVAEVPTPAGYAVHCGETYSDGHDGVWSSWPSHAAPEDMARYAEHEEIFFPLTSGSFLMREDGRYCTGVLAKGVREIHNGEAIVTPLGSHEIVVTPGNVGYYAWFYVSFLKKQYNKYSTDSIRKVYVK